jgi:predicted nuclease of predicted toxin-antitoxin system
MNLLADENVPRQFIDWLRNEGHDVVWAAEVYPRYPDALLLNLANQHSRVLLTADLDFGELVFRQRLIATGIILLRLHDPSIPARLRALAAHWPAVESHALGQFVVVSKKKVRVRRLTPRVP